MKADGLHLFSLYGKEQLGHFFVKVYCIVMNIPEVKYKVEDEVEIAKEEYSNQYLLRIYLNYLLRVFQSRLVDIT